MPQLNRLIVIVNFCRLPAVPVNREYEVEIESGKSSVITVSSNEGIFLPHKTKIFIGAYV